MMKKILSFALILVLAVGVLFVTGCGVDPTKDFKNPKTITVTKDKNTTYVTYDDDGSYEEDKSGSEYILKSKDNNIRLSFEIVTDKVSDLETRRDNFAKDTNKNEVIKDVLFNGNKGFVIIDKTYATAQVYTFIDEANNVTLLTKISDMSPSETEKGIASKGAKEALYNKDVVQEILKTINYKK